MTETGVARPASVPLLLSSLLARPRNVTPQGSCVKARPSAALRLAAPGTGAWADRCSIGRWSWWLAWFWPLARWPPSGLPPPARTGCTARTSRTATAVRPPARAGGRARRALVLAARGRRQGAGRGTGGARTCRTRRGRGLANSVGAACPHREC